MPISDCFPDLWIDPVEWATDKDYDPDDAAQAVEEASWLLFQLTGGRFSSKYVARRDLYRSRAVSKFYLRTGPVAQVYNVQRLDPADDSLTTMSYTDLRGGLVRISNGSPGGDFRRSFPAGVCVQDDTLIQVEYLTKPNLPAGAERQVKRLANEFYKSITGGTCALPERVTTITRQGASWTVMDPMDFLKELRTGLGTVDQWITGVTLRGWASVIDPLQWLEFVETEVIGCGEDFVPA